MLTNCRRLGKLQATKINWKEDSKNLTKLYPLVLDEDSVADPGSFFNFFESATDYNDVSLLATLKFEGTDERATFSSALPLRTRFSQKLFSISLARPGTMDSTRMKKTIARMRKTTTRMRTLTWKSRVRKRQRMRRYAVCQHSIALEYKNCVQSRAVGV